MPKSENNGQRVRLFKNGRNQAVRIPREMELAGNEAIIRREGDSLVLTPLKTSGLLALLDTAEAIDFAPIEDPPGTLDDIEL